MRDFDRPLDARGREDAELIGKAMVAEELRPDVVLCSSARRCAETCDIVTAQLPGDFQADHLGNLYNQDHEYYIELLSRQVARTILLIGHNPMMEDTTRSLAMTAAAWPAQRLEKGFPTAGLAVIDLEAAPIELRMGGHLVKFLTPKRLKKLQESSLP